MKKSKPTPSGAKANAATRVVCVGLNPGTQLEKSKASSRSALKADWSRYADSRLRQFCLR
jgi:hypothetical protein